MGKQPGRNERYKDRKGLKKNYFACPTLRGHAFIVIKENSKHHHEDFWCHGNEAPGICADLVIMTM
jgi:hypothetical protein